MTNTILSCSHVNRRFVSRGRATDVLSDISLDIHAGQIVVIRGRSGTGKSTLLQILAGLDCPTTGHVKIAGRTLEDLDAGELTILRRQTIGFIFQSFNLIPSWTAGQNVEAALIHTPLTRPERHRKVCEMLERLELGDRIEHLPSELSVGQQQRVAIARALVHSPAIVFADEPTGDVDPETAKAIMDCLARLVRENQTAFIVCTHGEFTPVTADQHYLLQDGRLKAVSVVAPTVGHQPGKPVVDRTGLSGNRDLPPHNGHLEVQANRQVVTGESSLQLFLKQKLTEVLAAEKAGM